ncbi:hypothetical protein [Actinospongicola halichondriae]|uniref:hypothetical protein n=1 Tax=Actinospongicola halichondriae TaxID=3236844 RepID=UPI003D5C3713
MSDDREEPEFVAPLPERSWDGLRATVNQAMEWGIELSGQLARIHEEQEIVVGCISAATIARSRFDQPTLPGPDPNATSAVWEDIAALADAVRDLVADPPPEFINALLPPYATAVALGQELQDAQRAMGLPVAPIPYERAPLTPLGGFPLEVPPEPEPEPETEPETGPGSGMGATAAPEPALDPAVQADLDGRPNPWVLLVIVVLVAIVAVAVGIGWR